MNIELVFNPSEFEYDIFVRDGDIAAGRDLATAVIISLFTWRRAEPDDDIPSDAEKYGYWAEDADNRWGSRLWLLKRAKISNETISRASEYIRESLQWMINDGIVGRVEIGLERAGIDEIDGTIALYKPAQKDPVQIKFNKFWTAVTGG
jgi:phage gp46-like protein